MDDELTAASEELEQSEGGAEPSEGASLATALKKAPANPASPDAPGGPGGRRRRKGARAKTISVRRMSKTELRLGRLKYPEMDYYKPSTRAECKGTERPCPYVSCKYHLYLDVNPTRGSIKKNFPDLEVWELEESCALDVSDRSGITLEEVGELMNLTRERVRQVETAGLSKLRQAGGIDQLFDYVED